MKKILLCGIALLLIMSGMARAALITIGTATYDDGSGSAEYKLIFDNDNNGNSVVWLDYTNSGDWADMMDWAAGLGNDLTINLDDGYSVTWEEDAWRLPATEPGSPVWGQGYIGYGVTSSEMGHLYYVELGNPAGGPMTNLGDFENLDAVGWYDSGTEYDANNVWCFYMKTGMQQLGEKESSGDWEDPALGMALRNASVTIKTLSSVSISGASSVDESSSGDYTAQATFSDSTSQTVTTLATWSENSSYASMDSSTMGRLLTSAVSSNQTVTITASYTYNGVTKSGTKIITINDDDSQSASGNNSTGGSGYNILSYGVFGGFSNYGFTFPISYNTFNYGAIGGIGNYGGLGGFGFTSPISYNTFNYGAIGGIGNYSGLGSFGYTAPTSFSNLGYGGFGGIDWQYWWF